MSKENCICAICGQEIKPGQAIKSNFDFDVGEFGRNGEYGRVHDKCPENIMTRPDYVQCSFCGHKRPNNERTINGVFYEYHCTNPKCNRYFRIFGPVADGREINHNEQRFIDARGGII